MDGRSRGLKARLVCHCLLLETDAGLVLVDTGYGLNDVARPTPRLSPAMLAMLNIRFREEETAVRQVEKLGFSPRDVRHIILTHLDFDHAGGLQDFPEAMVHVLDDEYQAAIHRNGAVGMARYRPMQMDGVRHWKRYSPPAGERWNGFETVRDLAGLGPEILMVPLRGHTAGHSGVAVKSNGGWLLHAGDAYFYRDEVRRADPQCTPMLRVYQTTMEVDRENRLANQERLRALSLDKSAGVTMICAHDAVEFERAAAGDPLRAH